MNCFIVLTLALIVALVSASTFPEQVHIALAGDDGAGNSNGMTVSWLTHENTASTTVKYGYASGDYTASMTGSSSAYYETFNHHVTLHNLSPNAWVYYIVGDELGGFSSEFKFKSAPISSNPEASFSFGVFADLGSHRGESTLGYLSNTMKNEVDLIWHGGDISYADDAFLHPGCLLNFCYEDAFNTYMNDIENWSSMLPYMTAPGNRKSSGLYCFMFSGFLLQIIQMMIVFADGLYSFFFLQW